MEIVANKEVIAINQDSLGVQAKKHKTLIRRFTGNITATHSCKLFAAEIFHDLHEEVMATSARGHGLMIRVQQLKVEFPSIEKAFLSQTNHTPFFSITS
ncbi:hypothetical protein Q3G72_012870 [Acer saccharum]|nr:hypothetical protein Q3G72_012870 [Acer saccharum]